MVLYPNDTVSIFRGPTYATAWDVWIDVYIYEQSDDQDAMNGVEWWQNEKRLLTIYSGIRNRDKLVTASGNAYIVKKVKHRNSVVFNFFEIQIREEND